MIKLLIADDEALVCIGLQSMLKWEKYNIEIVGIAHNGAQEEEMIESLQPDIVITDIKMPVKSGLEVAESVREKHGRLPLFIILTSYEEFEYAHAAIKVQAVDYLVKLDLTPQTLENSIKKVTAIIGDYKSSDVHPAMIHRSTLQEQRDKFLSVYTIICLKIKTSIFCKRRSRCRFIRSSLCRLHLPHIRPRYRASPGR